MSQLVAIQDYATAVDPIAAMRAAHKERQRRLAAAAYAPPRAPAPEPEPEPVETVDILDDAINRYRLAFDSGFSLACLQSSSKQIMRDVAVEAGLSVNDLKSDSRARPLARARQHAMWLIAQRTTLSLPAIGKLFKRDHTTVLHAIRFMNRMYGENVRGCGTDAGKVESRKRWESR